ncbi:hypothetical protein [Pseudomonas sp. AN3A02]|uniref:hypothetical protein n=1 Tax=Pseudomonas sp. AN3A02 TaxID=2719587 RepID=UPI001430D36E|nr:hypothetical protein [Pseudomonas sp. AN3A02]NIL20106.1 hypothetical protein [Pseudomonas sp. AN3A02]
MLIHENSVLLQSLIFQLSDVDGRSSFSLTGDVAHNLMGLRDLLQLEMITREFSYGVIADPLGFLLTSAEAILLTKRGNLFSG